MVSENGLDKLWTEQQPKQTVTPIDIDIELGPNNCIVYLRIFCLCLRTGEYALAPHTIWTLIES